MRRTPTWRPDILHKIPICTIAILQILLPNVPLEPDWAKMLDLSHFNLAVNAYVNPTFFPLFDAVGSAEQCRFV
ncbi:hypothetical protein IR120_08875 [Muribacter muris]|uniref:hypothetical protein n=1 Tax=Muribacter muris TaxID=67855 RepID=UPI0018847ECE|nr:hypothetical protein [Muribacter muris]MBF0785570.1 hypothetical protein [Muribacter muris]MBF0827115.1 hypothetical protein [Muribacter muris]